MDAETVLSVLLFPGLLFSVVVAMFLSWVDRKVSARAQMRVGPPMLQPLYDFVKYSVKEVCVPIGMPAVVFLLVPLLGVVLAVSASWCVWRVLLGDGSGISLVTVVMLITGASFAQVLGGVFSRNPIAGQGAFRELKLSSAYELPLWLALLALVVKSGTLDLGRIAGCSNALFVAGGWVPAPSMVLALVVGLFCAIAKAGMPPFDVAEAETELAGGALIEYSGWPLGLFKLLHALMLFLMPSFLVMAFWGGFSGGAVGVALGVVKILALVVVMILVKNTTTRVRVDQAERFFKRYMGAVALLSVVLAFVGW